MRINRVWRRGAPGAGRQAAGALVEPRRTNELVVCVVTPRPPAPAARRAGGMLRLKYN